MIDPITAYLGRTDSFKDAGVRGLLAPLLALLAMPGVASLDRVFSPAQKNADWRAWSSLSFPKR